MRPYQRRRTASSGAAAEANRQRPIRALRTISRRSTTPRTSLFVAARACSAALQRCGDQPRDVAHLAAGPRLALAVEMQARVGIGDELRASGRPRQPSRLSITASACRSVGPSGRPAIARTHCSNCETAQASIVQWPELCGRGRQFVDQHAGRRGRRTSRRRGRRPAPSASAMRRAIASASRGDRGIDRRRGDGPAQHVVLVAVLDRHIGGDVAGNGASDDHRDLQGEVHPRLERRRARRRPPPSSPPRRQSRSVPGADRHLALAVVAEARRLQHRRAGRSRATARAQAGARPRPACQRAVGTPMSPRKRFSVIRS